jgi:sugar transferase (PEP-CTERM system associated)
MTISSGRPSPYIITFCLVESVLMICGVYLAFYFRLGYLDNYINSRISWAQIMVVPIIMQVTFYYFDLYNFQLAQPRLWNITRVAQATAVGGLVLAFIYYIWPDLFLGRGILLLTALIIFLLSTIWRTFYAWALKQRIFASRILFIGSGSVADSILEELSSRSDNIYNVVCILDTSSPSQRTDLADHNQTNLLEYWARLLKVERRRDTENLVGLVRHYQADLVVVAMDEKRECMPRDELLELRMLGVPILLGEDFFELVAGRIMADRIVPSWLVFSTGFSTGRLRRLTKRMLDIGLSSLGLLLSSPLALITAMAVRLESPGPVIYRQERIGLKGRSFEILKFRSMVADAEKASGPVWAKQGDSRVTRVGKWIRKLRLDEIPQMWNVLKGDMSFVGPRPERPVFVEQLAERIPFYEERHNVEPGITGWAQVCYPYGASEAAALEKLNHDLYYIKHSSLSLDILIVIQTIKIMLFGGGGR